MNNNLASPLRPEHTSSMGYRIWYKDKENPTHKLKDTYWGTQNEVMNYISFFNVLRVDHWLIEAQSWVTIWLTSKQYLSLKGA